MIHSILLLHLLVHSTVARKVFCFNLCPRYDNFVKKNHGSVILIFFFCLCVFFSIWHKPNLRCVFFLVVPHVLLADFSPIPIFFSISLSLSLSLSLFLPLSIFSSFSLLFFFFCQHTGAVRTLDVNPFMSNLLVSGGSASEVYICDLNDPEKTMYPGQKEQVCKIFCLG